MSQALSVAEVARHFPVYLDRVARGGESFVLMQDDQPVAELRPLPVGNRLGELPALMASLPRLSEIEATEFGADLSEAREELARGEIHDPWRS